MCIYSTLQRRDISIGWCVLLLKPFEDLVKLLKKQEGKSKLQAENQFHRFLRQVEIRHDRYFTIIKDKTRVQR